ncbi:MAG TPA: DNA topoisomerase IV subunit A [Vicinamibacterales bacterium]|jgi:DNA gyrase/topoisomerase IV subunit A|nr:DNA topoisomerase IV subunit A [Vicinamibacterales bacterium]
MAKRRSEPSLFDLPESKSAAPPPPGGPEAVALHEAAQTRYLNYALSVITSRALPDVRDGLKPVQRRILYTMWQQNLTADAKHRKCAKVVGDVMGSYHPHGDAALYETLVRMAQPFSLRYPLIDGSGNFGSLDGDSAAAMRYTECRLARIADEMLSEIEQRTVHFRPNYDGTKTEPVVLPARIPNLFINGTTGIAVGMATNIPPHNLGEICAALIKLLDNPNLSSAQLCRYVKGPDFPTGGQILNSPEELKEIYKTGSGTVRLRATWEEGPSTRGGQTIYITSIPYAVNKAALVERIADVVLSRKLPPLLDVKDVSTDDVRIALEIKKDADAKMVMAYLFKNTPLQTNFIVNLTCLIPTENAEVGRPERLDLHTALMYFLQFRLQVVTNRLEHELEALKKRIHILEGFEKVFDALDEIIKIIRKSDGKADSAEKIIKRFGLDAEQADAILELKLYRLARLEILVIQNELADKRKRARQITALLKDEEGRWKVVRDEIEEIQQTYGGKDDKRRTLIETEEEVSFTADDFIVEEDNVVIISRDGWVKRQKEVRDLSTTRLREGDSVHAVTQGSTRATVAFFSNFGVAYTARIIDVPASTGYGEPVQKLFKMKDGEKIIAAFSLDPRVAGDIGTRREGEAPRVHALAVTSDGYSLRFSFETFVEASTRAGRRYARPSEGVEVVGVARVTGSEIVIVATAQARGLLCRADEVNYLSGPGKGVILIKLTEKDDHVLGFVASTGERDLLRVETSRGGEQTISTAKYEVTGRGGKGRELLQRGQFTRVVPNEVENPQALTGGG